ncbi:hypothetical protein [Streptomyces erythrochromogenes]
MSQTLSGVDRPASPSAQRERRRRTPQPARPVRRDSRTLMGSSG